MTVLPFTGVAPLLRASSRKLEGHRFDSQSGHMPGLWIQSQSGRMQEATNPCFPHIDVSLSPKSINISSGED